MGSCESLFLEKSYRCPQTGLYNWGETNLPLWANGTCTKSNIPASLLPSPHIAQTPRRPSLLRAMWGVANPPPPHPHTHPSSHPPGTYLSVAFIHNPRDLNLFPPHRPRLFLSLLFLKYFMLSSLSSFFFFLFTLLLVLYLSFFSAFYLLQSTQIFQHPYLQERIGGGGGEDEH